MATGKIPAFQFYTGDWLKDPDLSKCAPATRGIWMDLLCAMHEDGRSGELSGTVEQLARLCRCSTADFALALDDLRITRAADVTSRNGMCHIVSRRMKRESDARKSAAARQKRRRHRARDGDVTQELRPFTSSSDLEPEPEPKGVPPSSAFRKVPLSVLRDPQQVLAWHAAHCRGVNPVVDPTEASQVAVVQCAMWCLKNADSRGPQAMFADQIGRRKWKLKPNAFLHDAKEAVRIFNETHGGPNGDGNDKRAE